MTASTDPLLKDTPGTGEAAAVGHILGLFRALGIESPDPHRQAEGIADTLSRLTAGYRQSPRDVVGDALFAEKATEPVLVRDIPFTSLCQHHLMPFQGRAHVAYLPGGLVVGLSKLARVVDLFAARLQTQTALTSQVAHGLQSVLDARGVGVWMEARHTCPGSAGTVHTRCVLGDLRLPIWGDWIERNVR